MQKVVLRMVSVMLDPRKHLSAAQSQTSLVSAVLHSHSVFPLKNFVQKIMTERKKRYSLSDISADIMLETTSQTAGQYNKEQEL